MSQPFDFKQAWEDTEVTTVSPNEQVFVTLRGNSSISVSMLPGYYDRANAAQIEEQLARTARLVFVDRTKAFYDLRSAEHGDTVRPSAESLTREQAEFKRRRAELAVEGSSDDGAVTVTSVGMTQFAVQIAPGTLTRVDESRFVADLGQAATRLMHDQREKMLGLKVEVLGGWGEAGAPEWARSGVR